MSSSFPIRLRSSVIRGFGRGSRELGIPTANLSREEIGESMFDGLSPGIYYGFAGIEGKDMIYKAAVSIGFNPTYNNSEKTCEPHLIAPPEDTGHRTSSSCGETQLDDFYGEVLRLSIIGHIRDELPFESVEKLVSAIKDDIKVTEEKCEDDSDSMKMEKQWCLETQPK